MPEKRLHAVVDRDGRIQQKGELEEDGITQSRKYGRI